MFVDNASNQQGGFMRSDGDTATAGKTIGARMRQARNEQGLSLGDMASKVGLSKQGLSNYERDKVTPRTDIVVKFCKATGTDIAWLLTGKAT